MLGNRTAQTVDKNIFPKASMRYSAIPSVAVECFVFLKLFYHNKAIKSRCLRLGVMFFLNNKNKIGEI